MSSGCIDAARHLDVAAARSPGKSMAYPDGLDLRGPAVAWSALAWAAC